MPKRIDFADERGHSGICVEWTPTAMRLDIHGWYDQFVGIQGKSITLAEFFKRLGITDVHVKKAFEQIRKDSIVEQYSAIASTREDKS